jgi:type II secretory pathway component PulF
MRHRIAARAVPPGWLAIELGEKSVRLAHVRPDEVEGLSAKAEPILLVLMGVMVLILALGGFLPMWDMVSAARGGSGGAR